MKVNIIFFGFGRGPQKNNYNIRIQHMVKIDPMISHKTQNFRAVKATMNKAKGRLTLMILMKVLKVYI